MGGALEEAVGSGAGRIFEAERLRERGGVGGDGRGIACRRHDGRLGTESASLGTRRRYYLTRELYGAFLRCPRRLLMVVSTTQCSSKHLFSCSFCLKWTNSFLLGFLCSCSPSCSLSCQLFCFVCRIQPPPTPPSWPTPPLSIIAPTTSVYPRTCKISFNADSPPAPTPTRTTRNTPRAFRCSPTRSARASTG